jgi:hypothetical protein
MDEFDILRRLLADGADVGPDIPLAPIDTTIQSVGDLVRIVEREHTGSFQYRGQSCGSRELLPTLTRPGSPGDSGLDRRESVRDKERHILKEFRTRWVAYGHEDPADDLRLSFLAQHHGVPTRLLDWSMNPLAALFFAVEESDLWQGRDCRCGLHACTPIIWAVAGHRYRVSDFPHRSFDELENRSYFVIPDHDENRAAVQSSIVSIWADPTVPFDDLPCLGRLWKIKIARDKAPYLLWVLNCLGVTRETLFPDPDGLGKYLSWKHRRIHEEEYRTDGRPKPRDS